MVSVTNRGNIVQHFCTTTSHVKVYFCLCSTYMQQHGRVCVHVREAAVAGEMWFHLLPLVLMNTSGICSDSRPVRTPAPGPPAPGLEPSARGNPAGGEGNEANLPPPSLLHLHTQS